jgi:hypothetical protein
MNLLEVGRIYKVLSNEFAGRRTHFTKFYEFAGRRTHFTKFYQMNLLEVGRILQSTIQ